MTWFTEVGVSVGLAPGTDGHMQGCTWLAGSPVSGPENKREETPQGKDSRSLSQAPPTTYRPPVRPRLHGPTFQYTLSGVGVPVIPRCDKCLSRAT